MNRQAISPVPCVVYRAETKERSLTKFLVGSVVGLLCVVLLIQTNGGVSSWDNLLQTYAYRIPRPIGSPIQTLIASPTPLLARPSPQAMPITQAYYYPIATAVPANPSAMPTYFADPPKQALQDVPAPAPAPESAAPAPVPETAPAPAPAPAPEPAPAPAAAVAPQAPTPLQPQYAPPTYAQQPQYPPQYPPQYGMQPQQSARYGAYPPAQEGGAGACAPCSNPSCDVGPSPGGCYTAISAPPGYTCECPVISAHTPTQTPPPILGSAEWKQLRSNQYGNPLAINETEAENGMTMAKYEAGQAAYQLARYLKHKANMAKIQAEIGNVVLKDLESVQPCRLVPGGPGGYRCAKSDDDSGDDDSGSSSSAASEPGGTPAPSGSGKNGVFGLGFMGL